MNFNDAQNYVTNLLQKKLPNNLYYHGLHHTLSVCTSSIEIGEREGVSNQELTLLKTAALYHDSGFIEKYTDNEAAAVIIAKNSLPEFGYSSSNVEIISNLILATKSSSTPKTLLEMIICDADHDYLGKDGFHETAALLHQELKEYGTNYSEAQWNNFQISFLETHTYYTCSSHELREPKKQKHLRDLKLRLSNCESNITKG